ncbi:MAG: hypothetical protein DCC43_09815 [Candidatus Brocadia sp.]|nr:MAG: hypothetical protein DCC43_09815 [Candidatus Brocadia sp.]
MARAIKERIGSVDEPLEKKLWKAADKLRKNMDAAEYKHVVLGLIFLKYISDAFEELYEKLKEGKGDYEGADPEDKNEYTAEKVFYVPPSARWKWLQGRAKLPTIGKDIDDAMDAIEKDNPSLKGVLPKVFAQEKLDKQSLGGLIDLVGSATLGTKVAQSKDVLGKVYEYFLGEFALAEGKKGGQFYTPGSVVKLLVEMLEPYEGRVFDPCCGSGGMFVQSEKFVEAHRDYYKKHNGKKLNINPKDRISIYGQESNQTTWRLAKTNLAIRGIDSSNVKWNNEGSFLNDMHKDLKADYIIANPPFNDSDWSGELLRDDARWSVLGQKLPPPPNNANYAWIQHFLYHLAPSGQAGFVLAKGSLTTKTSNEGDIRKAMVENDLIDCIVNLPTKLFLNTQIPACLWFICRNKSGKPSSGATHHLLPVGEGHYRGGFDFSEQLELARMLRNNATPAEQLFWELVRDRRFLGLKFRRQHQIGAYIADFYCDEKKLVVELDGGVHNEPTRIKIDHKRDAYMKSLGITVFRLSNEQLMRNPEKVLTSIASAVSPSPFGRGEGVRVNESRNRKGEMLFIDARNMGFLINRKNRELSDDDIALIATTYHNWRTGEGKYKDVQGFCKSATLNEVQALNYVLTPGRYIGLPDDEDDFNYEERIIKLKAELHQQMQDEIKLNEIINRNLEKIRLQ